MTNLHLHAQYRSVCEKERERHYKSPSPPTPTNLPSHTTRTYESHPLTEHRVQRTNIGTRYPYPRPYAQLRYPICRLYTPNKPTSHFSVTAHTITENKPSSSPPLRPFPSCRQLHLFFSFFLLSLSDATACISNYISISIYTSQPIHVPCPMSDARCSTSGL